MAAGELDVTVFQDAAGQGSGALDAALKLVKGRKAVDREGLCARSMLVTPDNMSEFTAEELSSRIKAA